LDKLRIELTAKHAKSAKKKRFNLRGLCVLSGSKIERGPAGLTSVITFKPVFIHWEIIGMSLLFLREFQALLVGRTNR